MATKFYLPSTGTAPLGSLAVDSNWEHSNGLERRPMDVVKSNTSLTGQQYTWPDASTDQTVLKQFQSKRLAAGYSWTTSDTVSMVMRCVEAAAQVDTHLAYVVRVVSGDGSTIRGTIGLYHATSTEFPTTAATRIHSARTGGASNFSSQAGDRIIIEIGGHGVTPTLNNFTITFGDPTATQDFTLVADDTNNYVPWVELSRDVSFDVTSNRSAYTKGRDNSSSNRSAYTVGANPSYPASSNRSAYTKGMADTSSNRASYTKGRQDTLSNRPAYTKGGIVSTSNRASYTKGQADTASNRSAYAKGQQHTSSNRQAYTKGMAASDSSRAAYTAGGVSASSNRASYTQGIDTIASSRAVYTAGASFGGDVESNRSAWVLGIDTILIPDGLVGSSGTWLDQSGSPDNLYQRVDETLPNDADYIKDTDPTAGHYIEFTLSSPSGVPGTGDVVVFWRGSNSSGLGQAQATVQLRQGSSTVIASQQVTLTTAPRVYFFTLTAGERSNITDWSDLRVRIIPEMI